jgi:hypothetical protein
VSDLRGLQGSEPAALLLVEATEKKVHVPMELAVRVFDAAGTIGTLADVDSKVSHDSLSVTGSPGQKSLYGRAGINSSVPP